MDDWGEIVLRRIDHGDEFWCLFDELYDDASGFILNRRPLVDAFREGNLYGLKVNETLEMERRHAKLDKLFAKDYYGGLSDYLLPCLCLKEDNGCRIIWTHTRARNRGFARTLLRLLQIEKAWNPLPGSAIFWRKCDIPTIH
jgi:hypothetical protein